MNEGEFRDEFESKLAAVPEEHVDRSGLVPGAGPLSADVVLVGEAPGETEVEQGTPFVGPAGKRLDGILEEIGVDRSELYVTNLVKSRLPDNRTPSKGEIHAWRTLLEAEIERVDPSVVILLGTTAARALLETDAGVTEIHGQRFERGGRTLIPVFHPAATLYDRSKRPVLVEDLRQVFADR